MNKDIPSKESRTPELEKTNVPDKTNASEIYVVHVESYISSFHKEM